MTKTRIRVLCKGRTKSGEPCRRYAVPGSRYCRTHQPACKQIEPDAAQAMPASQEELGQLASELDELIERLRSAAPDYTPPPFSPSSLLRLIEENLTKLRPELSLDILERLKSSINQGWLDVDTWKGVWYMLNYALQYQSDFFKRRMTGEYETDEWGFDHELFEQVKPFFTFMYKVYWRVSVTGLEHIPAQGRALLVVNHSGPLPWDSAMVTAGVYLEHPAQRLVRNLYDAWVSTLPFFSDLLIKCGQVLATDENGVRLLEQEQLVAVFPEGDKGTGKLFKDRYRLAPFGRGEFVQMALKTRAPMIPAAVVGAEETYPSLYNSPTLATLLGLPYLPVTPTFPWLGLLGLIPLPTKWTIDFGTPIPTDAYEPDATDNVVLVSQLADQVRDTIQQMLYARLSKRRSIFWD